MAEITNDLMYEVLKQIQGRLGHIEQSQFDIKAELQAMRGHVVSMQQDVHNLYGRIAAIEVRLGRIDRRLELSDEAVG